MSPVTLGLCCALFTAILAVVNRDLMRSGANVWAVSVVSLLVGGMVLLPTVDPDTFFVGRIDGVTIASLIVANVSWAAMTFFDARAYDGLSAGLNAILNALRLVLVVLIGWWIFGEVVPWLGVVGSLLILGGIILGAERDDFARSRAVRDRGLAVVCGAIALSVDKYLTTQISVDVVLLAGFFLPAIVLLLMNPGVLGIIRQESLRRLASMLVAGILTAAAGWTLVYGFSQGEFWSTLALRHADIVFTFILGVIVLGERERFLGRGIAALVCAVGAACVTFSKG